jgi:transcriptional regulator with XRE-family HTH domain
LEKPMTAAVPEPRRQLALNIKRTMRERGVTPVEVSDLAEISPNHLSLILRGKRTVQLDTLVKLAGALDVPAERLLEGIAWVSDGDGGGEFRRRGGESAS